MSNIKHSALTGKWFTPQWLVDRSRKALGGKITLDPASCAGANKIIQAEHFYTKEDNGLTKPWFGSVFVNSPGSCFDDDVEECLTSKSTKRCTCNLVGKFWDKLITEWRLKHIQSAIWIGFSIEQLQTLQKYDSSPLHFTICVPKTRIHFVGKPGKPSRPSHANFICGLGLYFNFFEVFRDIGVCL